MQIDKIQISKIIVLFLVIVIPKISKADICIKTFEQDSATAKAIFVGKVVKIDGGYWHLGHEKLIFTFQVLESFRGINSRTGYVSAIGPIGGCCNVHYKRDSTYLVFAYSNSDSRNTELLWTNDCTNTELLSKSKVIYNRLGIPKKHKAKTKLLKYINEDEIRTDSMLNEINKLKSDRDLIKKKKSKTENYLIGLVAIIGLFSITLFRMTKKLNRP